ncbi:UbiA family prenyltransferase, partial [Escherichia coli]|nr:UbiA family prenyltransferase [Escherichia coli]
IGSITAVGVLGAIGVGALASAILVANNLRDIPTDSVTGKTTLAVRLGDTRTRQLYLGLFGVTILCTLLMAIWRPWAP